MVAAARRDDAPLHPDRNASQTALRQRYRIDSVVTWFQHRPRTRPL